MRALLSKLRRAFSPAPQAPVADAVAAPQELWHLVGAADADFIRVGKQFKELFVAAGLQPHHAFLDVGCGNGYYLWRMLGAGAGCVVGVDPNWLFLNQFLALKHFLPDLPAWHLPLALEELPAKLEGFDTVFSMGVLYHRRSPMDHLLELKQLIKPGGQLVLETLVIDGDENAVLVPEGRYGRMGNVWFIPSTAALENWLKKMRFNDVRVVDVCQTTTQEQRSTDWMRFQSLSDFLDPNDSNKTIEGYPAPRRTIFTATV